MTEQEYREESRHIYQTRLGIMGLGADDHPTAEQHNLAVEEAKAHVAALRREDRKGAIAGLLNLRDSL